MYTCANRHIMSVKGRSFSRPNLSVYTPAKIKSSYVFGFRPQNRAGPSNADRPLPSQLI